MFFETVTNIAEQSERIRKRPYGVIMASQSKIVSVRLRPLPKLVTGEALLLGSWYHKRHGGDVCWIYYNQPLRCRNYLALKYFVSSQDCSVPTLSRALGVLDKIAWIKRSDAILCDVFNRRISDRALSRFGWEAHCPQWGHRNFIKRFYGDYPAAAQRLS